MKEFKSPCMGCNERKPACHSQCVRYKIYYGVLHEVGRRKSQDVRRCEPYVYKPVLYNICTKRKRK